MTHPVPPPAPPPIVHTLTTNTQSSPIATDSSPEFQLSTAKGAASLGAPLSVGYEVKQIEITPTKETSDPDVVLPSRSIQPLQVSNSNSSTIAKLKKIAAVSHSEQQTAPSPTDPVSSSIQPLQVSDSNSSTIAKLKKFAAVSHSEQQTAPAQTQLPTSATFAANTDQEQVITQQVSNVSDRAPAQVQEQSQSSPQIEEFTAPAVEPITAPTPQQTPPEEVEPTAPTPTPQQTQSGEVAPTAPTPTPQQAQPEEVAPTPQQPSGQIPPASTPPVRQRILELNSDRQEYDAQRQIVTAYGNALLRFDGGVLDADRLQVNLENLIAVGQGNVAFTRGQQVLRGERFTYNFVQDSGDFLNGSGEIFIPTAGSDFSGTLPTDVTAGVVPLRPPSDRITANQPQQQITNTGGIQLSAGSSDLPQQTGAVRRVRFQAERINFYPEGWQASNVRFTNDPFSPPELEVRADTVTLTRETPFRDRIKTTRQRLVFDQGLSLPIPRNETVIDRRQRQTSPALATFGYDGEDRGGVYVERTFNPIDTEQVQVSLTPQFFAQEAFFGNGGNIFDPALFGLKARASATLGTRTSLRGSATFTSLDLGDVEDNLRASLRLRSRIGNRLPHSVALEYSYRDRLYNGSLGYQTVQSSLGGVIASPVIPLGNTGIGLSYQAGVQRIRANTDRIDLLQPIRENNRITLNRFQGSAALNRGFLLWQGKPLPATATEGLRYTAAPVVPSLQAFVGVTGTSSHYSNGDNQTSLTGTVGLLGQFGHFSRPFLDYTAFNISYSQSLINGISPFIFDRVADTKVLSAGLTQQIYGPFRIGVQAVVNLDTGDALSTDYILEYSRRTYGITLRYNPQLELGSLSLRISDFNWVGGSDPFSDSEIQPVVGGVRRLNAE